jgi:hypothetical protein
MMVDSDGLSAQVSLARRERFECLFAAGMA